MIPRSHDFGFSSPRLDVTSEGQKAKLDLKYPRAPTSELSTEKLPEGTHQAFLVSGIDEVKAHSNFAEILVFKCAANTLVFRVQSATKPKPKTNLAKG